jgi:hypothetical protein
MLLWAQMMLISLEDKTMLLKADMFCGDLASMHHIPMDTSIIVAFITFWNIEGHTLVTIGIYPLGRPKHENK